MRCPTSITVRAPLTIRRRPGRRTVVTPAGNEAAVPVCADPALIKALARAFRWQRLLDEGRYASISELAAAERIERGYLGRVLQLTLLAPALVEAIIEGQQGEDMSLQSLMADLPSCWSEQLHGTCQRLWYSRVGNLSLVVGVSARHWALLVTAAG